MSELKKNAFKQISLYLNDISNLFIKARTNHGAAENSLKRLADLQIQKEGYMKVFLALDEKNKAMLAEKDKVSNRIQGINEAITQLLKELETVRPQHEEAKQKLNDFLLECNQLFHHSSALDPELNALKPQKEGLKSTCRRVMIQGNI